MPSFPRYRFVVATPLRRSAPGNFPSGVSASRQAWRTTVPFTITASISAHVGHQRIGAGRQIVHAAERARADLHRIEDGDVGGQAHGEPAAVADPEHLRRT
jgi:hypothetical protein